MPLPPTLPLIKKRSRAQAHADGNHWRHLRELRNPLVFFCKAAAVPECWNKESRPRGSRSVTVWTQHFKPLDHETNSANLSRTCVRHKQHCVLCAFPCRTSGTWKLVAARTSPSAHCHDPAFSWVRLWMRQLHARQCLPAKMIPFHISLL